MLTLNYSLEVLLKQWYEPFRNETLDMQHILLVHIKIYIPALLPPKKKRIFYLIFCVQNLMFTNGKIKVDLLE
jgi:hypothetical protein